MPRITLRSSPSRWADLAPSNDSIWSELALAGLCRKNDVDQVVFAYSDVTHEHVMHKATIGHVLPAGGCFPDQLEALAQTITAARVDAVVSGTPAELAALIDIDTPIARARYEFAEAGTPKLSALILEFLAAHPPP